MPFFRFSHWERTYNTPWVAEQIYLMFLKKEHFSRHQNLVQIAKATWNANIGILVTISYIVLPFPMYSWRDKCYCKTKPEDIHQEETHLLRYERTTQLSGEASFQRWRSYMGIKPLLHINNAKSSSSVTWTFTFKHFFNTKFATF